MEREERPIVFTVSRVTGGFVMFTKDSRAGTNKPSPELPITRLLKTMEELSVLFNDKGYAVLFEVDWYAYNA